jgi:hypothetical protein
MITCNHSGVGAYLFCFTPSVEEAANTLDEISAQLRANCVQEIKSISWTLEEGLSAYVILAEPFVTYPLTDGCTHTGEEVVRDP